MLLSKKITSLDKYYIQNHEMIQLAMRINDPSKIPQIIDKLSKIALPLHLTADDTTVFYNKKAIDPIFIPNFDNIEDASIYMFQNHSPDFTKTLAVIGVNSDTVVFNSSHMVADGLYLVNIVDALSHLDREEKPCPLLPVNVAENFAKEMSSPNIEKCPDYFTDPNVTRALAKGKIKDSKYLQHKRFEMPVSELSIYNKENKTVKGLTEALWSTTILSVSASNGELPERAGIATCVNMRQFLPEDIRTQFNFCNHFSNVTPSIALTKDMTIEELGKRMRADFNSKIKKGHLFSYLNSMDPSTGNVIPGNVCEVTNVGRIKVSGPIDDVYIKFSRTAENCDPLFSHLSYSIDGHGKNTLKDFFIYQAATLDDDTVSSITKGVEFGLKNLTLGMKVGDAYKMIQDYQKSL